ncbi:hypothetical protein Hanom_Chr07g00671931 [Helianthus anomalus]
MNAEWDTHTGESDPSYHEGDNSFVFNCLPKHHEAYKLRTRATYNPSAKHDYNLIYRPV